MHMLICVSARGLLAHTPLGIHIVAKTASKRTGTGGFRDGGGVACHTYARTRGSYAPAVDVYIPEDSAYRGSTREKCKPGSLKGTKM